MDEVKLSTRRQLELMQTLQQLADARAASEASIASRLETELTEAEEEYGKAIKKFKKQSGQLRRELENQYADAKREASEQQRKEEIESKERYAQRRRKLEENSKRESLEIERKKKESEWEALAVYDAGKDLPGQALAETKQRLQARHIQLDGLNRDANTLLGMRKLTDLAEKYRATLEAEGQEPTSPSLGEDDLQSAISAAHEGVLKLQEQWLPTWVLESTRWIAWLIGFTALGAIVGFLILGFSLGLLLFAPAVGGALTAVFYVLFGGKARKQSLEKYGEIWHSLQLAGHAEQAIKTAAEQECQQQSQLLIDERNSQLEQAEEQRRTSAQQLEEATNRALQETEEVHRTELQKARQELQDGLQKIEETFPPQLDQLAEDSATRLQEIETRYETRTREAQQLHDSQWQAMSDNWHQGFAAVAGELSAMTSTCQRYFPDWTVKQWDQWTRSDHRPAAMQFGEYRLPLSAVKQGVSADPRLVPPQTELQIPALMPFDEQPSMIITAEGKGRATAVGILKRMMLRFLTAIPAGKLRFTVIDPSALGENFANFMHLADFDEQLIGGRIWTDSRQIDDQLNHLANHLEKVLQKYLRNEFETLEAYNLQAGEVAEPYHVLVVANFPTGLSDNAMRKLTTIAKTGPRCGVYTLMSIDTAAKIPADFILDDLLKDAVHLECLEERLRWNYPLYEKLPLELDTYPDRDKLTDLLHEIAQESRDASRVEVPFDVVAPADDQIWDGSTAHELVVPIGRAGANEMQSVRLGRGTSQHTLISGKTGSGKSTLLHALITNAALNYSPLELELYLVDFKKGVEFKAYATGDLPHAQVIAIESEREFGVSVLERLDEELRRRGEVFRDLGVQDLASYRKKCSDPMPRVLLIVDEFQELFVTDDKLAQDAALLLDRLVRQGRAFGVHVILGSQTLAGAYSLARSTLGQMAVRIALECSEADAHLILSDDNTAARLLSRPGEAIYNDQNGMVEGNSLFQVVWLADESRQEYLAKLREHLPEIDYAEQSAIVFEGNVPADPRDNESLVAALAGSEQVAAVEPTIWLGSAVRIGPPTQLTLRRQGGQNLIVVGQDEPLALGILANAACAVAAGRQAETKVTVLNGARPESAHREAWQEIGAAGGAMEVGGPKNVQQVMAELTADLKRRTEADDQQLGPHVVIVHDLAQFRDLRLTEDDFSFSSSSNGKPPSVDKQFRELLKEGPAVGIHMLVWCDSYNSMTRVIDRLTLREIDFRVALQMSPGDSTSIIDSPAAGRLGEHRAILYRDDLGSQEKFRPYQPPTPEWLDWVRQQLADSDKLAPS